MSTPRRLSMGLRRGRRDDEVDSHGAMVEVMTTPDEHLSFAAALEAKARVEMDANAIQQVAESWVDAIDDVHRLRELVKDKSRRLQSMVERLDEIKWHYDERDRMRAEEHAALMAETKRHRQAWQRRATGDVKRIQKLTHLLHKADTQLQERLQQMARALGVDVPSRRAWSSLIKTLRKRLALTDAE